MFRIFTFLVAITPQDDINSLEFSLMKNRSEILHELDTHKLNETTAILLKMIIAIGIYPQFSVEDPHNNHRVMLFKRKIILRLVRINSAILLTSHLLYSILIVH